MDNSKVTVKINGAEYTLMGDQSEDYLFSIANYVDKRLKETLTANPRHSTTSAAVLTAITLADEYFDLKKKYAQAQESAHVPEEQLKKLNQTYNELMGRFKELNDEYEKSQGSIDELNGSIEQMAQEKNSMLEASAQKDDEIGTLNQNYNELMSKFNELNDKYENSQASVGELNESIERMTEEKNSMLKKASEREDELEQMLKENALLKEKNEELVQVQIRSLNETIADLKGKLLDSQIDLVKAQKDLKDYKDIQFKKRTL